MKKPAKPITLTVDPAERAYLAYLLRQPGAEDAITHAYEWLEQTLGSASDHADARTLTAGLVVTEAYIALKEKAGVDTEGGGS